jgi:hypothetical protein
MGEDIVRLERLAELARTCADDSSYLAAASKLGWTADERRTGELQPTLRPFLLAYRASLVGGEHRAFDELAALWSAFDAHRIERLVGCLARVPRPQ